MHVKHTQLALDKKIQSLLLQERKYSYSTEEIIQDSEQKDQKLHLLTHGYVKRYTIASDGSISIQVLYGPGDIFPSTIAIENLLDKKLFGGLDLFYYESMCDVKLHKMDVNKFSKHVATEPILYRDLLEEAAKRMHSNIQRLENMSILTIYGRVAHQLLFYARRFGSGHEQGTRIDLPLKHQDLADVLNSARETVTRELSKLVESKFIIQEQHHIVVTDMEALEYEAYSQ